MECVFVEVLLADDWQWYFSFVVNFFLCDVVCCFLAVVLHLSANALVWLTSYSPRLLWSAARFCIITM